MTWLDERLLDLGDLRSGVMETEVLGSSDSSSGCCGLVLRCTLLVVIDIGSTGGGGRVVAVPGLGVVIMDVELFEAIVEGYGFRLKGWFSTFRVDLMIGRVSLSRMVRKS